jgi:hypothetical protein
MCLLTLKFDKNQYYAKNIEFFQDRNSTQALYFSTGIKRNEYGLGVVNSVFPDFVRIRSTKILSLRGKKEGTGGGCQCGYF